MIERLLVSSPWLALALGVIFYAAGYYLAIYEAYLYHAGAKNFIVFQGGYELTPALQEAIVNRRRASARLLTAVLVLAVAVPVVWGISVQQYSRPDLFSFLMGGLLLLEAAAAVRHFRNIVLFRYAPHASGAQGKIEYSKRLAHTLYFYELYSFAALYLFLFLMTGSWLFLGGAFSCFISGRRQRDWTMVWT